MNSPLRFGLRIGSVLVGLLLLGGLGPLRAQDECPARGSSHLGKPVWEWRETAARAVASNDPACLSLGLAMFDFLDRPAERACQAAARLAADGADDPDLMAFQAIFEFRCGHIPTAHRLARKVLGDDPRNTLGWTLLAAVLEARFRTGQAQQAYQRALELDPENSWALTGMARVVDNRADRREYLEKLLAVGGRRGESKETLQGARDGLAFIQAIGDRRLWVVEKAELPVQLKLQPLIPTIGQISGWLFDADFGELRRVPVLLDSGASGLHLEPRMAVKAGITEFSSGTLFGGGGSQAHAVERGTIDRLAIGPMVFRSALGIVASGPLHSRGAFKALLGFDIFSGWLLRVHPGTRLLDIETSELPEDEEDPLAIDLWPKEPGDVAVVSIEGQLLVPITVEAAGQTTECLALFDTGAAGSMLDRETAERLAEYLRSGAGSANLYGGSAEFEGRIIKARMRVGSIEESIKVLPVIDLSLRSRLTGIHVGAFLGQDVLARHSFELDMASGVLRMRADRE